MQLFQSPRCSGVWYFGIFLNPLIISLIILFFLNNSDRFGHFVSFLGRKGPGPWSTFTHRLMEPCQGYCDHTIPISPSCVEHASMSTGYPCAKFKKGNLKKKYE